MNASKLPLYGAPNLLGDGCVLPAASWLKVFRSGRFNKVPFITGTNRGERRFYQYNDPAWRKVLDEHPIDYVLYAHYLTLGCKLHAVDDVARAMTASGHREVYAYRSIGTNRGT